jgi:hypothetical protein
MLLTIDIGNTQTAIGLFDGAELEAHWRFTTRSVDTADEVHLNLAGQFGLNGYDLADVDDVSIASVVPTLTSCWATVAERITGKPPVIVGPGVKSGLPIRYDNPAEIGADRVADAVQYLKDKYDTDLFDQPNEMATFGLVRAALIELYGFDRDYVYASCPGEVPEEGEGWFIPWSYGDEQTVDRDTMVYIAVKAHDPALVADWSVLKDDNGYYPGVRVATLFADRYDITRGVGRPKDMLVGEVAIILANTDRVFDSAGDANSGDAAW